MTKEEEKRKILLNSIVEIELRMFKQVKTSEPSLCKERLETFITMRKMTHSVFSIRVLEAYLRDLNKAETNGRNLLTEKYARIDNRIPPLKTNHLIDDIVRLENQWMKALSKKYSHCFMPVSSIFEHYLSCELETYSDETLHLYFTEISRAMKEGRNLAEERYTKLFQQLGFISLAEIDRNRS